MKMTPQILTGSKARMNNNQNFLMDKIMDIRKGGKQWTIAYSDWNRGDEPDLLKFAGTADLI